MILKLSKNVGLFCYTILFIFAVIFFKERTIFMDASFIMFSIAKDSTLAIQNFRFGSAFIQLFPLISLKLGLPLEKIILSYSVGFVVFFSLIYSIIKYLIKNESLSNSLLLYNVLIVSGTFYWIQSEQIQGSALLLLYFALLMPNHLKEKWPAAVLAFLYLLLFILVFIHPIIIFPFIFFNLFLYLSPSSDKFKIDKQELISLTLYFLVVYLIKLVFFKHPYDSQSMGNLKNLITLFPYYFDIQSNKNFLYNLFTDYYLFGIIFLVNIGFYILKSSWKKLSLMVIFSLGYFLLINVSYPEGANKFYMESYYVQLSLFVIIPFIFDTLPQIKIKYHYPLLFAIVLIRLVHIYEAHRPFKERLAWERSYLTKSQNGSNKKIISSLKDFPKDKLFDNWATAYEFWLLSTIEQKSSRSVIFIEDPNKLLWATPKKDAFVTQWGVFEYKDLPAQYFKFRDTNAYVIR